MALSKQRKNITNSISDVLLSATEAFSKMKETIYVKFEESVDVAINLGIDPKKSDQVVRGALVLPNGTGKTVRVAVFAQGDNANLAKEAGASSLDIDTSSTKK